MKHIIGGLGLAACLTLGAGAAKAQVIIQTWSDGYMENWEYLYEGATNYTYDTTVFRYVDGVLLDERFFLYSIDSLGVREVVADMQRPMAWIVDGAPAVVTFSRPEVVLWEEETTDIFTEYSSTTRTRIVVTVTRTSGDHPNPYVMTELREFCSTTGVSGDTNFGDMAGVQAQCDGGYEIEVQPGEIVVNTHTTYITDTIEREFTNEDITVTNHWAIQGQSQLIGTVHAATQSGLFDASRGFIGRIGAPREGAGPREGLTMWAGAMGREARTRSGDRAAGSDRETSGLQGGLMLTRGPFSAGLAVAQSETDVVAVGSPESAQLDINQAGLHVSVETAGWFLTGAASVGEGDIRSAHGDGVLGGVSQADYGVSTRAASLAAGRRFEMQGAVVTPFLGADRTWATLDAFDETGGLALSAPETDIQRSSVWGGVAAEVDLTTQAGWRVALGGRVRAFALTDGETPSLPVTFSALPDERLRIRGVAEDASGVEWRGTLSADLGDRVSARLSGEMVDGRATWSQEWSAEIVVRW